MSLLGRDLLTLHDLTPEETLEILEMAQEIKARPENFRQSLSGRTLAMVYEKPSLRTRVTFEAGMTQLGGHAIYLAPSDIQLGKRESVPDVGRNLERWVDVIMARTFSHDTIVALAESARIPVLNALSDYSHPCQALADFLTLKEELGDLKKVRLCYVGDGNNVVHSLLFGAAKTGAHLTVVTPEGFEPSSEVVKLATEDARKTGATLDVTTDPTQGVRGANAVYTDAWASMGQESEAEERARLFRPYQVNEALMAQAEAGARFLHCLPAHRGQEVTDGVADSPHSVIFNQAENRLHAQKALLHLVAGKG